MAGERPVWQSKDVEVWVNRNTGNTYDLVFTHIFKDGARIGNQVVTALTTQEVHRMVTGILSALEYPVAAPPPAKEETPGACPICRAPDEMHDPTPACPGRAGRGTP